MTQDSESVVVPRDQQRQLDAEQLMDAAGTLSRCGYGEDAEEVRAIALRLAAAPSTSVREERLRYQAEFLVDRLSEFEGSLVEPSEAASEFYGHVAPAIARLEAALVPSPDEGKRHG